jgi:hypothetical protein
VSIREKVCVTHLKSLDIAGFGPNFHRGSPDVGIVATMPQKFILRWIRATACC